MKPRRPALLILALVLGLILVAGPASAGHEPGASTNQTFGPVYVGGWEHDAVFDFKGGSNHASNWNFSNKSVSPAPNVSQVASGWIQWESGPVVDHNGPDYRPDGASTPNHTEAQENQTSKANFLENATDAEIRSDTDDLTLAVGFEIQTDATSSTTESFASSAAAQVQIRHTDGSNEFGCLFGLEGGDRVFSGSYIGAFGAGDHYYHFASYKNESGPSTRLKCGMALKRTVDTASDGSLRTKIYANTTVPDQKLLGSGRGGVGNGEMTYDVGILRQLGDAPDDPADVFQLLAEPWLASVNAKFTASCTGQDCTFDASDSKTANGTITSFDWTFGDGSTGNGERVTHTYSGFGTFEVTLTVTNSDGESDSASDTVVIRLAPEFNTTAGLVPGSTLRHVGVDWRKASPAVWGRDTRSTGSQTDGTLVEWNETLTHENTFTLCPGTDRQENNQPLGLAVSKDTPGRPVNACVDTALSDPVILARKTNGDVQSEFVAGTATGVPVDVGARSLNNVSTGENTGFRQLLDVPEGDVKWRISDGKSFARHAIDRDAAEDPLLCSTDGGSFGTGTECRDADGFVIGSDSGVSGADVGVHGDVVHLLDEAGETLERRTPGLALTNSTSLHPAHHAPVAVSKTGRFVAHVNLSGSDAESVVIRHAGNGSRIVETTNFGGDRGVNSLAWHPRDERVYAVNDTRIWAFNVTTITSTSDEAAGEDTTVDAEPEPTQEDDTPAFGDPQQTASALNISLDAAQTFLGLILVLALTAGSVFAASEAGVSGGGSLAVGLVAMGVGVILVNRLGWFPIWVVFGMFMLAAAAFVLRAGNGGGA